MGATKRTLEETLEAIKGSSGIKTLIAERLSISRPTVDAYLVRWATARVAYEQECEMILDMAEAILVNNLQLAREQQKDTRELVSTSDARWVLTMKGHPRGYTQTQRQEVDGRIVIELTQSNITPDDI